MPPSPEGFADVDPASAGKHVLHLPDLLPERDIERIVFPRGVVCDIQRAETVEVAKRVELLGQREDEPIGVLRHLFIGYTPEETVLELASRSNYVVEVRSTRWRKRHFAEAYRHDFLIVKRVAEQETQPIKRPQVLVPSLWLERVGLDAGDRVIISNPMQTFLLPSPGGA